MSTKLWNIFEVLKLYSRLDDIAADAGLQEKSIADLTKLATMLRDGCEKAIKEYQEKLVSDPTFDGALMDLISSVLTFLVDSVKG